MNNNYVYFTDVKQLPPNLKIMVGDFYNTKFNLVSTLFLLKETMILND